VSLNGVSCPVCYGRGLRFGGILVSVLMVDIGEDVLLEGEGID